MKRCLLGLILAGCTGATPASTAMPVDEAVAVEVWLDAQATEAVFVPVDAATPLRKLLPASIDEAQLEQMRVEAADGTHHSVHLSRRLADRKDFSLSVVDGQVRATVTGGTTGVPVQVDQVTQIHLLTRPAVSAGPQPLRVQVAGRTPVTLDATTLASLERTADSRGRLQGWDLVDILRLAVGRAQVESVRVVLDDSSQPPVELGPPATADHFFILKHSAGGELRVQRWATGTTSARPDDVLRGIQHIEVTVDDSDTAPAQGTPPSRR